MSIQTSEINVYAPYNIDDNTVVWFTKTRYSFGEKELAEIKAQRQTGYVLQSIKTVILQQQAAAEKYVQEIRMVKGA